MRARSRLRVCDDRDATVAKWTASESRSLVALMKTTATGGCRGQEISHPSKKRVHLAMQPHHPHCFLTFLRNRPAWHSEPRTPPQQTALHQDWRIFSISMPCSDSYRVQGSPSCSAAGTTAYAWGGKRKMRARKMATPNQCSQSRSSSVLPIHPQRPLSQHRNILVTASEENKAPNTE